MNKKFRLKKTILIALASVTALATNYSQALQCTVSADSWGGGYVLNVTVNNDSSNSIDAWQVSLN